MCGYCTEGAALSYALLAPVDGTIMEFDPFILPCLAQDASNWPALLTVWPGKEKSGLALLMFCRGWEDALRGNPVLQSLEAVESLPWVKLRESLCESIPGPEWSWAIESGLDVPAVLPMTAAVVMLETYGACWLAGGDEERWSEQEFEARFPWLFLALTIVSESDVEASVLQAIALTDPARTPTFDALDLWLQRRAACVCVSREGIAFVERHFEDLRFEVLASALLGDALNSTDLITLQTLLAERPHEVMNLTVGELVGAIDHRLTSGSRVC